MDQLQKLADELGLIDSQLRPLLKRCEEIKAQFRAAGDQVVEGKAFEVEVSTLPRKNLNADRVRAILTPEQVASVTDESQVTYVKCKARMEAVLGLLKPKRKGTKQVVKEIKRKLMRRVA